MSAKVVAFAPSARKAPNLVNGKVCKNLPPIRRPNADVRSREYLTPADVASLQAASGKTGRYGHRDATMILLSYRHGLRGQ